MFSDSPGTRGRRQQMRAPRGRWSPRPRSLVERIDDLGVHERVALRPDRGRTARLGGATSASGGAQLAAFALPGIHGVLGLAPLGPFDVAVTFVGGVLPFIVSEAMK